MGHFLRPEDHLLHFRNQSRERMIAKSPSKILQEGHKKFLAEKIKPNIIYQAKKTLLPKDDVQMWLKPLMRFRRYG